jgi:hypothetical protein
VLADGLWNLFHQKREVKSVFCRRNHVSLSLKTLFTSHRHCELATPPGFGECAGPC